MSSVLTKFIHTVEKYGMLDDGDSVLVGFSGGADSTALLHILVSLNKYDVTAVHVNHMIRGNEADRDEEFCREYCDKNGIKFISKKIDVPKIAESNKIGIEEAARNERYKVFQDICKTNGIKKIAVAHNADDNAETVIINQVRGCGLNGLCGIKPVRDNIIRPLIQCSKSEIIDYCNENGLKYVFDSTNNDNDYTRNNVRNNLIPLIKQLNPNFTETVSSNVELISEDNSYLTNEANKHSFESGRSVLSSLPKPILSRVLIKEFLLYGINPEKNHIDLLIEKLKSNEVNFELSLPNGNVKVERDFISVGAIKIIPEYSVFEGINENFDETVYIGENLDNALFTVDFSTDAVKKGITVRRRREGDVYKYGGINRKVKKLLQQKKITNTQKESLPVFISDNEIIWIPGFPVSDSQKNKDLIKVSFYKKSYPEELINGKH